MSNAAAIVPCSDKLRTTIRLETTADPLPTIHQWCHAHGYALKHHDASGLLFQKGVGIWVSPMKLAAHLDGNTLTLQAWVHGTFIARLFSLFILPREMHIRSGGFVAALPRKMMRGNVNKLLAQLGAPAIA